MKTKNYIILITLLLTLFQIDSTEGFFLMGRTGLLIKTDPKSGLKRNYPDKKGPTLKEVEQNYSTLTDERFEAIKSNLMKKEDIQVLEKFYEKIEGEYVLKKLDESDLVVLRYVLLTANRKNEIPTGLDTYGIPMPHKFPRVFEPKTKANFDLHFAWGYKFSNDLTFGFSTNLTNFLMPSLEIMLKYDFDIPDEYGFDPYIGGAIYGGFLDGFPIGFNLLGGVDFYPMYNEDKTENLFISTELRMGPVLYTSIYFDTGINSEGIWKELNVLMEGGFYVGSGYIFTK